MDYSPKLRKQLWKLLLFTSAWFGGSLITGCWAGLYGFFGTVPAFSLVCSGGAVIILLFGLLLLETFRWIRVGFCRGNAWSSAFRVVAAFILLAVSVVFATERFSPAENLAGSNDPGMYLAAGSQLSRTGSFKMELRGLELLNEQEKRIILRESAVQFMRGSDPTTPTPWSFYLGYPLTNQAELLGPAIPHFPAGFAVTLASAFRIAGWPLAQAIPALAVAGGILALAVFMCRQIGVLPALLFVPLACAHPIISWFANSHFAEPVLFFTASLAFVALSEIRRQPPMAGIATVVLLFAGLTIKIDALVLLGAVGCACIIARTGKPACSAMILTALALAPPVFGFLGMQSGLYLTENLRALAKEPMFVGAAFVPAIVLIFAATMWRRKKPWFPSEKLAWRTGLSVAALTLLAFFLIRTEPSKPDMYFEPALQETMRSFREDTLARLDWYWIPFGFVIALLGGVACLWRRISLPLVALGIAGLGSLLILGYDLRCDPIQPTSMRRLIPFALPFLLIGTCAWAASPNRRVAMLGSVIVFPVLFGGEIFANRRLGTVPDYQGAYGFVERVASDLPDESIILLSSSSPLSAFAVPLRTFWGRQTWVVRVDKTSKEERSALRSIIQKWQSVGYRVFVLGQNPRDDLFSRTNLIPISRQHLESSFQSGSYESLAGEVRRFHLQCFVGEFESVDAKGIPAN